MWKLGSRKGLAYAEWGPDRDRAIDKTHSVKEEFRTGGTVCSKEILYASQVARGSTWVTYKPRTCNRQNMAPQWCLQRRRAGFDNTDEEVHPCFQDGRSFEDRALASDTVMPFHCTGDGLVAHAHAHAHAHTHMVSCQ